MAVERGVRRFLPAALRIALWTLASRVLGLVRDRLMFAEFGRGPEAGAFFLAWTVPNLFRRLLGEGALTAAFVPVLSERLDRDGIAAARRSFAIVAGALAVVLLGLLSIAWGVVALLPEAALARGAQSAGPAEGESYAYVLRALLFVLLPYVVPICIVALMAAAQNVRGRFTLPALAPLLLNMFWIGGILVVARQEGSLGDRAIWLGGFVLVGGFAQLALQIPGLWRSGLLTRPRLVWKDADLIRVARSMLPMLLGLSVVQMSALVTQLIAAFVVPEVGANSVMFLGNRLLEFPHGLLGIALGTAVFPLLSLHGSRGESAEMQAALDKALASGSFLAIPACLGLIAAAPALVEVLFVSGRFGGEDAVEAIHVAQILALALPGLVGVQVLARAHYALGDMRTPVRISLLLFGVNLVLQLVLAPLYGTYGLAACSGVTSTANALALLFSLGRKHSLPRLERSRQAVLQALLAALPMAGFAYWAIGQGAELVGSKQGLVVRILFELLAPIALAGLVFFAVAILLGKTGRFGDNELLAMLRRMRQRSTRS
ncbi:MAG: murein biosynthesis integral membrane protein MurJ [Planctomycetota bacterium]|nr:MAG: murein biosynthesis integral membrane protein MurJ [Planctomycetota bacterium]